MPFHASIANQNQIDQYTTGMCHVFATALHRELSWDIELILDQDRRFWEDPKDGDNYISSVVHVYAIDNDNNAWDIHGVRPLGEVQKELRQARGIKVGHYDSKRVDNEEQLQLYVGTWNDRLETDAIERPLSGYRDEDIAEAAAVAVGVLADLPGFPNSHS